MKKKTNNREIPYQVRNDKRKIKLLIIDLYGVMTMGNYMNTCRWLAKKYKLNYDMLYEVVYHKWFSQAAVGKMTELASFAGPIKELGLKETAKGLRKKHLSFQHLNKSVFKYLYGLKNKGYEVVLLSKNTKYQFKHTVAKCKLDKYFDDIINTLDLGLAKSDPRTVKHVLKKYKVKPKEAMMVDDQDFNLTAPKKIGVYTILYKNFKQFKKDLDKLLK